MTNEERLQLIIDITDFLISQGITEEHEDFERLLNIFLEQIVGAKK